MEAQLTAQAGVVTRCALYLHKPKLGNWDLQYIPGRDDEAERHHRDSGRSISAATTAPGRDSPTLNVSESSQL